MKENYYHNLAKMPAMKAKHMPSGLEDLAQRLVNSGRFRVDTVRRQNFVRWNRPFEGVNMMFSHREIFNPDIVPRTTQIMRNVLCRKYSGQILERKLQQEMDRLHLEAKKNIDVDAEVEIVLARLIVQCAEPPVIMLLIYEGTEVFVSYSYNVGDMLDMQTWQEAGDSSGLQATEHKGCAVFVSCGGNPLVPEKKIERPTDGFHALSRMMVIAGQELAHYSDIIRQGRRSGSRFSADFYRGCATEVARVGRLQDMNNVRNLRQKIEAIGLKKFVEVERSLKFFREHRKWSLKVLEYRIKTRICQVVFILLCKISGLNFLKSFYKEDYICQKINIMLADMLFNLEPEADAYRRPDPVAEEMIMCIEALARVQQQSNKWGIALTKVMYPNLYKLYYLEILPACIEAVEKLSGDKFPEIFRRDY